MTSAKNRSARTALIVLGMHRSGTSAMAGVLAQLGAALPKALMPPTDANPKGYFESVEAYRLNDAVLASAGSSWDDPAPFDVAWYRSPSFQDYRLRAAKVIGKEFGVSKLFVLKDPRICRLLPFWRQTLADLAVRPLHVCIHRHPREVASSLSRREGWPETVGILLWLRHVLDAEADSRGQPRVFVSYDMLLSDWRRAVDRIREGLHVTWPRQPDSAAGEIDDFLSGELRHFRAAGEAIPHETPVHGWVARAFGILERWAADGEQTADHAELDALKAALDEASPLLGQLSQESRGLQARLTKVEADLASERAGPKGELEEIARDKQIAENNLAQMRSAVSHLEKQLDKLRDEVKGQADEIARMTGEEKRLRAAAADLEREKAELALLDASLKHELSALRDEVARVRRAASVEISDLKAERDRLKPLEKQVEELSKAAVGLGREKAELVSLNASLGHRLSLLSDEMARGRRAASAEISGLTAERDRLRPLEKQLEAAQAAHRRKEAEFEAYKQAIAASTSWRLTAPLRGVSRLLKKH